MLTKLIKYEWMATSRYLLPLYLVLVFISAFSRIIFTIPFIQDKLYFIPPIVFFIYIVSLIILAVTTFLIVIMQFHKNLLTGEGYLMFTLPVKVRDLINSKLIIALVWACTCIISVITSLLFVIPSANVISPEFEHFNLNAIINSMTNNFGTFGTISFILFLGIALIANILLLYTSIAIGQSISSNKFLGSVIAYIGIYTIFQAFSAIMLLIGYVLTTVKNGYSFKLLSQNTQMTIILSLSIAIFTIGSIVFYIVINHTLKTKLNLE